MRVFLRQTYQPLTLGTSTPGQVVDAYGRLVATLPPLRRLIAQAHNGEVTIAGQRGPWFWVLPSSGGYVYAGDGWYRGRLLLLARNGLSVINYVDLEEYLYSVVGAEMYAHWPAAALQAQAVAARSYAVTKRLQPADRYYDLGTTERHQVYRGLRSEQPSTRAAVDATRGQILTYRGGIVLTQYAANDNIVRDVFGGRGMSQRRAYELAKRQYNYLQILGHFFPGTRLGRIQGY
ncbi:MAG: SpoIID/LytB domain-containing protein [Gloeomargarita sp. SKYBB_i_bin120]|nr:SpoIID/LytB domain-containing protein [Gloeomargarita sp. SKYG98]MCS7291931.1 SpoIID/LytB domain-containing protein [Gloeomargarita sp. SKYB120]MDW8177491.1 SpoIID/LytB domain-containing protein [Gloeomargarita sp. SKYBB_i_bin120]